MIDHFGINCSDLAAARSFYDKVLGILGYTALMAPSNEQGDVAIGYGKDAPDFWISTFDGIGPNREMHIAFKAEDAAAVRAFYDAAIEAGAESLHEPRLWPEYHDNYYGAFVRDPDGNNVEAVCHKGDS